MPALHKVSVMRLFENPCCGIACLLDADLAESMMYTLLFYCTCNGVSMTGLTACSLICSKQMTHHKVMSE